jgi:lipoprotein signal peptidase
MPERSYRVLLWALALAGLLADQATKYGVFGWLAGVEHNTYALFQTEPEERFFAELPHPFDVNKDRGFFLTAAFHVRADGTRVPHVNHGALFGLFGEHETTANLGFAVISLLAAIAIAYWSLQKATAADRWLCGALGLILAGTLGNFYDRVWFNGVRDFLHWNYKFNWPVFNIADCCLVCGAGLLLLQAFTSQPQRANNESGHGEAAVKQPAEAVCVTTSPKA